MMSINNNPFKIKENSISNSTANGSNGMVNSTSPNSTSATIKTRTFIPNENILKKASIFNQIGNANSNSNTSLNKTPITKSITKLTNNNGTSNTDLTATSATVQPLNTPSMIKSPPLAKPKSNGVLTGTNDSNSFNHNSNNNNNNNNNNTENSNQTNGSADNSFDATDTSSSDLISTISSVNTKDNSELKTPREKEYDEDEKKIQEKCQQNEESTKYKNISSVHVINSSSISSSNNNNNNNSENGDQNYDINVYRRKLADEQYLNKQLKLENDTLHEELQDIRHEMEELQDQFRLDDADEFRQLQAELEIAAKNCRILQFKLRKLEKKNESLETEKILLQDKLDEISRETGKLIDLEEELLIAKEVSIRLHGELEQAQEWRITTENLNKELKKQLDELKDHLDNEIKSRNINSDHNELVLVNKLYESMFREYFMQEQLYTMSNNLQSQNVSKQLREVTDLLSSYQQKIAILNDEIHMLKQQSAGKDKEMDQMRLQLKNLKRSKSQEPTSYDKSASKPNSTSNATSSDNESSDSENKDADRKSRSGSVENSETLIRQVDIGKDENRLLRNKIMRLEDDLLAMTQERDSLLTQLEKIEDKAMKSLESIGDNDTELEIDSNFVKQMNELKNKIDQLNSEAKQNDDTRNQLSSEIQQLREKLDDKLIENETKNLTDSDKLLRDSDQAEYFTLKSDLEDKNTKISLFEHDLDQKNELIESLKSEIELKESLLDESKKRETEFEEKYTDTRHKLYELESQIEDAEQVIIQLKSELDSKSTVETSLRSDTDHLNDKLNELSAQIKEKINEIEFLNKENNALQERVNSDESRLKLATEDVIKHKQKCDQLLSELDAKNDEFSKFENLIKNKEIELNEVNKKLVVRDQIIRDKVKECEICRYDLNDLQLKYNTLGSNTDERIKALTSELESLSVEKNKIYNELVELAEKHDQCAVKNIEAEKEKAALKKLESQALNAKYEMKIQYLELEIDTLRSKIRKLLKEKEVQDQILKENQLIVKEIALKYTTDSETWNRQKQKLLEKEKLYEESVDMRKELKKAADKLRQKLQSLEEQIIDKQNKHTIEKNNWETQRIQYLTTNNRLEEQLSKLSTLKRSKKEIEFAWDKERREMANHIQNLEDFIKALQLQLTTRNNSMAQVSDQYGQNEKIQSLFGENEFLKNRIKELEVMLDEMEQVKRFLFDVKEAYDADRHEWVLAKEEFRYQLEIKENLWMECNMRLNQIINVIQAIQSNEPIPVNLFEETNSIDDGASTNGSLLNNLVGGTSNLLDFKLGSQRNLAAMASKSNSISSQTHPLENSRNLSSSKMNISNLKSINEQGRTDEDNLALIDITKDRKELNIEFDQAFKKMNRVKDNYGTHMKFMDIVKSKSMKALNRKSSTASLPQHELLYHQNSHESRGSVPPEYSNPKPIVTSSNTSQRAKSVSKEPVTRNDSQNSQTSQKSTASSIFTAPSRFFSLSRIRSRFSSQPPPPIPTSSPSSTHLATETFEQTESDADHHDSRAGSRQQQQQQQPVMHTTPPVQIQITQQPVDDRTSSSKKNMRERALSPSKILRSLRPRSPFTRTSSKPVTTDLPANIITTTVGSSGANKSFTVGSSLPNDSSQDFSNSEHIDRRQYLTSASYQSGSINSNVSADVLSSQSSNNRFVRANTAGPSPRDQPLASRGAGTGGSFAFLAQSLGSDKMRSASCEYIDNNNAQFGGSAGMNRLEETLDENDEVIYAAAAAAANQKQNTASNNNNSKAPPPTIQVSDQSAQSINQQQQQTRSRKPNLSVFGSLNVSTSSQSSRIELLKKNFDNVSQDKSDIVKTVKFKEPEKSTKQEDTAEPNENNQTPSKKQAPLPPPQQQANNPLTAAAAVFSNPLKVNTKAQENKLMQVLDDAMLSSPSTASSISSTSQQNSQPISMVPPNILITSSEDGDKLGSLTNSSGKKLNNVKFGGQTSLDEINLKSPSGSTNTNTPLKPPVPTAQGNTLATNISNAFGFRNKFSGLNKAKTLDTLEPANPNFTEHQSTPVGQSNTQLNKPQNTAIGNNSNITYQNTPILTSSGKPIQSILRRSETPPNNKLSVRQTSIESNGSARETSIEKILQSKTSTSRPLMFNEKK